jgi:hypothetical protein
VGLNVYQYRSGIGGAWNGVDLITSCSVLTLPGQCFDFIRTIIATFVVF